VSAGAFSVVEPGVFTTIQDLGRAGHRASGVPQSGAMDRFALVAANLLVGNPEGAAALECVVKGPTLVARRTCLLSIAGGDLQPRVNGSEVPTWTGIFLAEGDRLEFRGRRSGARCYVAVAGGFKAERWLGSASTYLLVGKGGFSGRTLKAHDVLELASEPPRPAVAERHLPPNLRPAYTDAPVLAAIRGPHFTRLAPASRRALFREPFTISGDSDRMGYRLEGQQLEVKGEEILSFGVAFGSLQLPASGQPILLMADHQTAGGYPIVAAVPRAHLPVAAQLLPGQQVRFSETTVEAAQSEWRRLRGCLDALLPPGARPAVEEPPKPRRPASPRPAPPRRRARAAPSSGPTASGRRPRGRG
jgi:antagonist of KipI